MVCGSKYLLVLLATSSAAFARIGRRNTALSKRQGYIPECTYTIEAIDGDTCQTLADFATITLAQFTAYNPQVSDCNALVIGNEYCLEKNFGQPDPTSAAPSSSKPLSTSIPISSKASSTVVPVTSTTSSGVAPPAPTQSGVASNCVQWDIIKSGDDCSVYLAKYPGITLSDLVAWNPAIGSSCGFLWPDYAICVKVEGFVPKTTIITVTSTSKPTASTIPGAVPAPGPTQAGVAENCNRWDLISTGVSCDSLTQKYGVPLATLVSWNPAIGSDCRFMWADYYICTGVVGFVTPTKASSSVTPVPTSNFPSPVQAGINPNCKNFHKIVSGDGCFDLAAKFAISLANFYSWNPAVKTDCSGLWLDYYVCVGI